MSTPRELGPHGSQLTPHAFVALAGRWAGVLTTYVAKPSGEMIARSSLRQATKRCVAGSFSHSDQYRSCARGMVAAGGRVSGNVGAAKRVTSTGPPLRSMNADTYALSRFDRKPPLPPMASKSAGPACWEPVTPMATEEKTLTNLRQRGGPAGEAGRSGPACPATASFTPPTDGFFWSGPREGWPLAPGPSDGSTVTVGRPTPPVSSRPLSGM